MRVLIGACCALGIWSGSAQGLVTIHLADAHSLGAVVEAPLTGGNYDVAVILRSDEQVRGVAGAAFFVEATEAGFIHVTGRVGSAGSTGTGTRYNTPSWDSLSDGTAYSPNNIAGPLGTTGKGYYGSGIVAESSFFSTSILGYINVTLVPASAGTTVGLRAVDLVVASLGGESLEAASSHVTFAYVPEPAMPAMSIMAGLLCGVRIRRGGRALASWVRIKP